MTYHGLKFQVRTFCGAPLVSAEGHVDGWQMDMLRNLLDTFKRKGHDDVIVDLTRVQFVGNDGEQALISAVKSWHPSLSVHVVATGQVANALGLHSFPFRAHLCSSLDEAAAYICSAKRMQDVHVEQNVERYFEADLPLAA